MCADYMIPRVGPPPPMRRMTGHIMELCEAEDRARIDAKLKVMVEFNPYYARLLAELTAKLKPAQPPKPTPKLKVNWKGDGEYRYKLSVMDWCKKHGMRNGVKHVLRTIISSDKKVVVYKGATAVRTDGIGPSGAARVGIRFLNVSKRGVFEL